VRTSSVAAPALLEALPDVVVVVDGNGCIVYANPALRALLGHEPAVLQGRPLTVLVPEHLRTAYTLGFARLLSEGSDLATARTSQIPVLHADGHEVIVEITRVTAALTEAPDADIAFERLLPTLCAELDWDAATMWQPEDCGGRLAHAGAWTSPGETVPALQADTRVRTFVRGEGLPGLVWQTREPVVVEDLWDDPPFLRPEAARADDLRTGVAFPVLRGDTVLGVCELLSRERRPVPPELLEVLASAGRQIGQFLARLRAESELRELADTLQRNLLPSHLPDIPGVQLAARYRARADGAAAARRPVDGADRRRVRHGPGRRRDHLAHPAHRPGRRTDRGGPGCRPGGGQHGTHPRADGRPPALRHRLLPGHRAAHGRRACADQRGGTPAAAAARRRRRRERDRRTRPTPGHRGGYRELGDEFPPARRSSSTPTA
jgi:PAS domain S-box-containing protein